MSNMDLLWLKNRLEEKIESLDRTYKALSVKDRGEDLRLTLELAGTRNRLSAFKEVLSWIERRQNDSQGMQGPW
jgi:hypothetical protein